MVHLMSDLVLFFMSNLVFSVPQSSLVSQLLNLDVINVGVELSSMSFTKAMIVGIMHCVFSFFVEFFLFSYCLGESWAYWILLNELFLSVNPLQSVSNSIKWTLNLITNLITCCALLE